MARKLRPALVRGRQSTWWDHWDGALILRGPKNEETEVPIAHLADDYELSRHLRRLADKRWVDPGAIDELREIAAGARA